ncbi:MAG: acylphosphatase [Leptolyngbyaceae cyanobacterium SM1_4_3]|nr:acylphosphatase [Leptolyngbyaceae cyanobacterium SM1_4_3]NJN92484.1 acylphosphatase [Leptolyngbyaceae cyanobacterium SL_5_14]
MAGSSSASSQPHIIRARVFISGRVQGVGYRAATADIAQLLELKGWVRNLRDRRVEAVFEGDSTTVAEMLRWCHQGPSAAIVDQVEVSYETPEGLKGFQVLV